MKKRSSVSSVLGNTNGCSAVFAGEAFVKRHTTSFNWLIDADKPHQKVASQRVLFAGHRQR
jgi:hypothetical protein